MSDDIENQNSFSQSPAGISENATSKNIETPSISLPKGGGAIKGIDEKFSVNPANGTSSFSLPLPFSAARALTPSLNLTYDSGAGNSIFGLGWSLSLSSIKRKTDKQLPQYDDAIDSDIFLFSEAEDLVPEYKSEDDGSYIIYDIDSPDNLFTIRLYKPRIEGLFARIERWMSKENSEIKWRIISHDNITTLFGWTKQARIHHPQNKNKVFNWLPEFVFDDKGNCVHYLYKKEDSSGFDPRLPHHQNRIKTGNITYTNRYLEKILYGNKTPYKKFNDSFPDISDYMFQAIFDYGEYDTHAPYAKTGEWTFRKDAFSNYKSGFEIRTTRLCKRVLFFHHFEEYDGLVKSVNFEYQQEAQQSFTFLKSVTSYSYQKHTEGSYQYKSLPPIEFNYQQHQWNSDIKTIASEDIVHAPSGLATAKFQFTDLYSEGISGILTEQAEAWYYKHNLGKGHFTHAKPVAPKPSFSGLASTLQLIDLDADGSKQLVSLNTNPKGYFNLTEQAQWETFRTFNKLPNIDFNDANTRLLDLNGNGQADLLITEDNVFTWYESQGKKGYSSAHKISIPWEDEQGPHIIFADSTQSIFLADMSGDGLSDIVRIRNGETCYWPNLGYGRFGAKITMDNAPVFDHSDHYNPAFIRITDIDGSGTADIIYLGQDKVSCWMNLNGNSFSNKPFEITSFPKIDNQIHITIVDLLGNGMPCIVWSSPLPNDSPTPMKYIDLMGSKKPHIMVNYKNNLGKEVSFTYAPSTKFYLQDKCDGNPWITRLPFPVHVVERVETYDHISRNRFVSRYAYHHGYFDGREREFRGFGMVEQWDTEEIGALTESGTFPTGDNWDEASQVPPVYTKTWFHTGIYLDGTQISRHYEEEYYREPDLTDDEAQAQLLPDTVLPENLSVEEEQEACRALKGGMLRQEVYALDGTDKAVHPYTVVEQNFTAQLLQPRGGNRHAVFFAHPRESLTYHYERNPADPRIQHALTLEVDAYGNVRKEIAIGYGRRPGQSTLEDHDGDKQ